MGLKILVDQVSNLRVIATGSSSFDLSQQVGEPLTGRKRTISLYPFSQTELLAKYNRFELREKLSDFLFFGAYPQVEMAATRQRKIETLDELANSYLLKDVLSLDRIRGAGQLLDLLKLLAFQIGSLVSFNELGTQVRLDVKTVGRYLDILEKAFVIKKITGFSRNLCKEVTSKAKYYFLDNGIRNALISQFNSLSDRDDVGRLWENFLVTERLKSNAEKQRFGGVYFWRTYAGAEIDWVEERDGGLFSFEFKWNPEARPAMPKSWSAYKNSSFQIVHPKNYLDFLVK